MRRTVSSGTVAVRSQSAANGTIRIFMSPNSIGWANCGCIRVPWLR